ncbi:MAG: sigma-54-dependent transcriptional regulator [Opitutales bacterium]
MLPRILILDDLFGRNLPDGNNFNRENLCAHFLWQDASRDASAKASKQKVLQPTAEAVFCRAQSPASSAPGDTVENDLESALDAVRRGWKGIHDTGFKTPDSTNAANSKSKVQHSTFSNQQSNLPWSLLLIDLCFYTGRVTEESHRRTPGMPEGRPGDDDPRSYFGLTLLDAIHRKFPELPIFILSSKPRGDINLELTRRGALGFIDRSALDAPEQLEAAIWHHGLLPDHTGTIAGHSLPLLLALREARRAAKGGGDVLIRGERGTGKELMARYIHHARFSSGENEITDSNQQSAINNQQSKIPFIDVNSAVFTPNLFASELFGIEPKTATGVDGKEGLIAAAEGGDLFLDEVGDMQPEVQAALLRVLQERTYTPVGSRKTKPFNARFISASNRPLEGDEIGFRADLLDRLGSGGTLWLPPLRERRADIPLIAERFVREAEQQHQSRHHAITSEALEALAERDWPGNIRELRRVVFRAVQNNPDVDYLLESHFAEPSPGVHRKRKAAPPTSHPADNASRAVDSGDPLPDFESLDLSLERAADWSGRLPEWHKQTHRLQARLLEAAVRLTLRRTPEKPGGEVLLHPALKLLTGDKSLTPLQAADLAKRILKPMEDELNDEQRRIYARALEIRPKRPRSAGRRKKGVPAN